MSIAPNTAEFLPGIAAPINFDFKLDSAEKTVSGTANKDDMNKAVGQQIKQEKETANKKLAADPKKKTSPVLDPRAAYEQQLNKYGLSRRAQLRPQAKAAQARIANVQEQHKPKSTMVSQAEVDKKIAMKPAAVPQAKTVNVSPEMQQRSVASRAGRAGLRLVTAAAEAFAPTPVQAVAMLGSLVLGSPQARRPQTQQARRQSSPLQSAYAKLGVGMPAPMFG